MHNSIDSTSNAMKLSQGAYILATGSAVPDICLSNEKLSQMVDTSDAWISSRTGIKERRLVSSNQSLIDLATIASNHALNNAYMNASDLELIILATSSPNDLFGSASQLQAKLGAYNAAAFDITAACSGFVIALITASQFIQTGSYKNILVVGADVLSQWVDWKDRNTCILFGDGAGAAILRSCQKNHILGFELNTNGSESHHLSIQYHNNNINNINQPWYYANKGRYNYLQMNGKEVYKFAVSKVPESIQLCLRKIGLSSKDISWLLLHQANQRILDTVGAKLDIPTEKIITNLQYYGNTSAASIPLALDETLQNNKIKTGDIIVIAGFGAGLTWGTIVIQWN